MPACLGERYSGLSHSSTPLAHTSHHPALKSKSSPPVSGLRPAPQGPGAHPFVFPVQILPRTLLATRYWGLGCACLGTCSLFRLIRACLLAQFHRLAKDGSAPVMSFLKFPSIVFILRVLFEGPSRHFQSCSEYGHRYRQVI